MRKKSKSPKKYIPLTRKTLEYTMFILYETKARAEKPDFYPCIIEEKFCFTTLGFVRNEQIS